MGALCLGIELTIRLSAHLCSLKSVLHFKCLLDDWNHGLEPRSCAVNFKLETHETISLLAIESKLNAQS